MSNIVIESNGKPSGTKVYAGGVHLTGVKLISIEMLTIHEPVEATITFTGVKIGNVDSADKPYNEYGLLPCPFCGSDAKFFLPTNDGLLETDRVTIGCNSWDCHIVFYYEQLTQDFDDDEMPSSPVKFMVDKWNTRV